MALYNCSDLPAGPAQDECWEQVAQGVGTGAYLENVTPGVKSLLKGIALTLLAVAVAFGIVGAIVFAIKRFLTSATKYKI